MDLELQNILIKICQDYAPECLISNSISYITDEPVDLEKFFNMGKKWVVILRRETLPEKFLEFLFDNNLSELRYILVHQKVSEKFVEKYIEIINSYSLWYYLWSHQKMSEDFIEKYIDKVNWAMVSQHQKLSEKFIEKYENKLEWSKLSLSENITESIIKKFRNKINLNNLKYTGLYKKLFSKEPPTFLKNWEYYDF